MLFLSPDFAKLRFRKTLRQQDASFTLNGSLYQLFFAVEENRSVAQIAAELEIPLADARQGLERLCAQGMIAPLQDQGHCLSNATMAEILSQLGYALGGKSRANVEMRQVTRQISQDGRSINQAQARTFLNHLCDLIPQASARERFRSRVLALLQDPRSTAGPRQTPKPKVVESATRGRTHAIIQTIIAARSQGNRHHVPRLKDAFRRYAIEPDDHGPDTPDDPNMVARLERMARKAGITLPMAQKRRSASELRRLLDAIIKERHGDYPGLAQNLRQQLRLKGIHPGRDDTDRTVQARILDEIHQLAGDLGVDTWRIAEASSQPVTRGRTKAVIDRILQLQCRGASHRAKALRTKLLLRGIDPEAFTEETLDDPATLRQVEDIAARLGLVP